MKNVRKGFTLIEMLVVIGIIAGLIAATIGGYSAVTKTAERTKCRELVSQVATAMTLLYQKEGNWPKRLAIQGRADGKLDADTAVALKDWFSLTVDGNGKLTGYDRFGIVTTWASAVFKRVGNATTLQTTVSSGEHGTSTIDDHILHFAVDADGDGIIDNAMVGGESVTVRATAIVWCGGADGYIEPYTKGLKSDDIYSWSAGQRVK